MTDRQGLADHRFLYKAWARHYNRLSDQLIPSTIFMSFSLKIYTSSTSGFNE